MMEEEFEYDIDGRKKLKMGILNMKKVHPFEMDLLFNDGLEELE